MGGQAVATGSRITTPLKASNSRGETSSMTESYPNAYSATERKHQETYYQEPYATHTSPDQIHSGTVLPPCDLWTIKTEHVQGSNQASSCSTQDLARNAQAAGYDHPHGPRGVLPMSKPVHDQSISMPPPRQHVRQGQSDQFDQAPGQIYDLKERYHQNHEDQHFQPPSDLKGNDCRAAASPESCDLEFDLWALDYPDDASCLPMQQRVQAMAATMALQDIQDRRQAVIVSQFFHDLDDKDFFLNVSQTAYWQTLQNDPVFAPIPVDAEVTSFEDLQKRARECYYNEDYADHYGNLHSFCAAETEQNFQPLENRALSVEQEERLAALGVTGPPKSARPHIPQDATPSQHIAPGLQPDTSQEPHDNHLIRGRAQRQGSQSTEYNEWSNQTSSYPPDRGHELQHQNHDQPKKKSRRKRRSERHKPHGHESSHYRPQSNNPLNGRNGNPSGQPRSRGNEPWKDNKQGQKRAYEEPTRYARGQEDMAGKRRKWD
ncbi:hypothetical protein LTR67_000647 [Exophiala xenobiotica]